MVWQTLIIAASLSSFTGNACTIDQWSLNGAVPLDQAVAKAKKLALRKDEFESTASFQERAKAAGATAFPGSLQLIWRQEDLTKFDADTGRVFVSRYAVDTTCSMFKSEIPTEVAAVKIGPLPKYDFQKQDQPFCLSKAARSIDGTPYVGSNAFGATRTVRSRTFFETGIFLGVGRLGGEVFPTTDFSSVDASPWLLAPATPEEARSLKQNAVLLIEVEPLVPYYASGTYFSGATFTSPSDVATRKDMLIGTPRCIALADRATGKIFASRPFEIAWR